MSFPMKVPTHMTEASQERTANKFDYTKQENSLHQEKANKGATFWKQI